MKKVIFIIIPVLLILVGLFYFNKSQQQAVFYPMGGIPFKVSVYDRSRLEFRKDMQAIKQRVDELELIFNSHLDHSEISKLNKAKQQDLTHISNELEQVLLSSKKWWKKTQKTFDITVNPLIELWQQAGKNNQIPTNIQIAKCLQKIGSDKFFINNQQILFSKTKPRLDLGGIAKGAIIDEIVKLLQEHGIKQAIIDAGGDIRAFGPDKFTFGLKNPIPNASDLLGIITLPAGAIVTSGNYERFSKIQGKQYSHIIDPRTGWPTKNNLISVTIIANTAIDADAAATALMVMGRTQAINFLQKNRDFSGILVEKNGDYSVWISANLESKLALEESWKARIAIF